MPALTLPDPVPSPAVLPERASGDDRAGTPGWPDLLRFATDEMFPREPRLDHLFDRIERPA